MSEDPKCNLCGDKSSEHGALHDCAMFVGDSDKVNLTPEALLTLLDKGGLDLYKRTNNPINLGKGPAQLLAELINGHLNNEDLHQEG